MTDLERLFEQARAGGASYHSALREVERVTGLDADTIARNLKRARRGKAARAPRKESDD